MPARELVLPLRDGLGLAELGHLVQRLGEIGAVHHRDAGNVVAHAGGVGVLPDVGALADLLDDVLFVAELRAVEDVDLESAVGALGDALGPGEEAFVVGLARAQHVIELEREGLGRLRDRDRAVDRQEGKRRIQRQQRSCHARHDQVLPCSRFRLPIAVSPLTGVAAAIVWTVRQRSQSILIC
jgi:hypothetical protein